MNGYTCTLSAGCVVWVKGKLEITGTVTGKVWFLVDKEAIIKGSLKPANAASQVNIYSKLNIEAGDSKVEIQGVFLAERELKLSGSEQKLTGLFWAKLLVDISGSSSALNGAVISQVLLKVAGSNNSFTYNAAVIRIN